MRTIAAALLALALLGGCATMQNDLPELRIDTTTTYQTIEGFGASGSWSIDPIGEHWSEESRAELASLLFSQEDGIGLSRWKFNAGATGIESEASFFSSSYNWRKADSFRPREDEDYDWSAQPGQQWFLRAAAAHGVDDFTLIFYSPPRWMTANGQTHPTGETGTTNLPNDRFDDFANYMATVTREVQSRNGVEFHDIVPLNEPNWAWSDSIQEANRYAVDDIKAVALALGSALEHEGIDARLALPEAGEIMALLDDASYREYTFGTSSRYNSANLELSTGGKFREYTRELLGEPAIAELMRGTITAHSYWSDYTDTGDDRLVRLRELVREDLDEHYPGAVYLQTEYCILGDRGPGRDLGMASALSVAEVIHRDLTILDAAEWSWWLAISPHDYKDGLLYTNWERPGDSELIITSRIFWALGNYSRFIRPGYVRIDAALSVPDAGTLGTESDDLLVSAYASPDGAQTVVVAINLSDADVEASVSAGASVYVTSDESELEPAGITGNTHTFVARSVTTLVID